MIPSRQNYDYVKKSELNKKVVPGTFIMVSNKKLIDDGPRTSKPKSYKLAIKS